MKVIDLKYLLALFIKKLFLLDILLFLKELIFSSTYLLFP